MEARALTFFQDQGQGPKNILLKIVEAKVVYQGLCELTVGTVVRMLFKLRGKAN